MKPDPSIDSAIHLHATHPCPSGGGESGSLLACFRKNGDIQGGASKGGWIRFYVDGKLDIENKWGGNPGVLGPARIGSWDGGGREWQGIFDEVIIFNVALAEDDIQTIMDKGLKGVQSVEPTGKITIIWGRIKDH